MKKLTTIILWLLLPTFLISQDNNLLRVEPPFWWTGMVDSNLQILIYGNEISSSIVNVDYSGVELVNVRKVENPNYLFLDIIISEEVQPGTFDIQFTIGNKLIPPYKYELKERSPQSATRKGFDNSDVVYLLMPDRFSNGDPSNDNMPGMIEQADRNNPDGRHGGDIKGIMDHLDYIEELGITALWCNPLIENNNPHESYHGYAITDFYNIDRRYGTNSDYINLVNDCHNRNIKVIMDMIFNHCSVYNWLIRDLPEKDWIHQFPEYTPSNFRISTLTDPYASEYDKTKMKIGWFDKHMADLNQKNKLVSRYLIQNTIWWIEYSGIDGIRVDTQPYSYKDFITDWTKAVINEYPEFNIVGETWLQKESITAYFQKDARNLDGYNSEVPVVTDFPMYYAISSAFNEKDSWTEGLARLYYVLTQDFLFAAPENKISFCDNHDLTRYYTSLNENFTRWKMGITFLLTTKRIPLIYYGTEILMTGNKDNGHGYIRQDFPGGWNDDQNNCFDPTGRSELQKEAFNYMKHLINWRNSTDVVQTGKLMHFIPEKETYVYFRYNENNCVMVAFNNSENEMKAIKREKYDECLSKYSYAKNVLTGETINYLDAITLAPKSVVVLELIK